MKRILVVDDVPVVRLVIRRILGRAGHAVVEASDGGEALTVMESEPIDVLVTDLWMPGTDGMHLLKAMRSRFPKVALVAMSGGSPDTPLADSLDAASDAGALVTVMKPVDRQELLDAIDEALVMVH